MERTVTRICADEMEALLQKPDLLLIDVRDEASFLKGHIESATHADGARLEKFIMQLPKSTPILLYCYHGKASLIHGQTFSDFGFKEVYSLNGGYEGWKHLKGGRTGLEKWLADHGFSSIDSTLPGHITPLMHASRLGDAPIAAELLLSGAAVDMRNSDGNHALWFACYSESLEILDLLIAAGTNLDNMNDNGSTCLMYASSSGKDMVVKKLLDGGADKDIANLDDFTALDMASSLGCLELLRGKKLFC